jgi:Protein of unknown function (DUF3168)
MSSASFALQTAVFAALNADAGTQSVLGTPPRLFDAVPRDAAFPYAVLGDAGETDWSTATDTGSEHSFTLDVWSRATGHREPKEIAEAIRAALDNAALTLGGHTLIDLRHTATAFARQSDGQTWRATLRFRAVTEPLS